MESIDLIPLDGDVAKITRRAEEFRDLHEALQRNLQTYLPLTMDALAAVHQKVKASHAADATRQMVRDVLLNSIANFDHWVSLDFDRIAQKVKVVDNFCWYPEVSDVAGCVFISGEVGRGDRALVVITHTYQRVSKVILCTSQRQLQEIPTWASQVAYLCVFVSQISGL